MDTTKPGITMEKAHDVVPPGLMDNNTKVRLQKLRHRVPRALFRVWCNSPPRFSGGYRDLNTTQKITPLAFFHGGGHSSVYELTTEDFASMAISHLTGDFQPTTELSSWAASLSFAMALYSHRIDDAHISIIDTSEMWHQNQIFFVPDLDFLRCGKFNYSHEYLAHGVIEGPFYRAVPLRRFIDAGFAIPAKRPSCYLAWDRAAEVTRDLVERSRHIGERYNKALALPMTLALICTEKRGLSLFKCGGKELQIVLDGIAGLQAPPEWNADVTITKNIVYTRGWGDVEQFIKLMRVVARSQHSLDKVQISQGSERQEDHSKTLILERGLKRKRQGLGGSKDAATKRRKQGPTPLQTKDTPNQKEEQSKQWLKRELKRLEITMKI